MNVLAHIALIGFTPLVLVIFALFPARRAVLISFFGGWLFLPRISYKLQFLPDIDKLLAISLAVLVASLIFDANTLLRFRPRLVDLPAFVFCVSPFFTSMVNTHGANPLGPWDGISAILDQGLLWGLPYFIGRCYFNTLEDLKELVMATIVAGLIYVPVCLFEFKMSPILHRMVYGINFAGISRKSEMGLGGYRPNGFIGSGLTVAMAMMSATLVSFWFWVTGARKKVWGIPILWVTGILYVVTVLCQVMGVMVFMHLAIGTLMLVKWTKMRIWFLLLASISPLYMSTRLAQLWTGQDVINFVKEHVSERRGGSLETRFENEERLIGKAMEQPALGWGRWGRSRVTDAKGNDITLTDGIWVIMLGRYGIVGIASMAAFFTLPSIVLVMRLKGKYWTLPSVAPMVGLCTISLMYAFDSMLNTNIHPVLMLMIGATASATAVFKSVPAAPVPNGPRVARPVGLQQGYSYGH